jgi:hypothetical protein
MRGRARSSNTRGTVKEIDMNILVAIIAIAAVVLLITGGVVPTLNFLLWVGIALAIIAVIVFLIRYIGGNKRAV